MDSDQGDIMKVRELITRLLDEPMDAEVKLGTIDDSRECKQIVFKIDEVEHWNYNAYLKFTDWRDKENGNDKKRSNGLV